MRKSEKERIQNEDKKTTKDTISGRNLRIRMMGKRRESSKSAAFMCDITWSRKARK
jgi:hypothetical protein